MGCESATCGRRRLRGPRPRDPGVRAHARRGAPQRLGNALATVEGQCPGAVEVVPLWGGSAPLRGAPAAPVVGCGMACVRVGVWVRGAVLARRVLPANMRRRTAPRRTCGCYSRARRASSMALLRRVGVAVASLGDALAVCAPSPHRRGARAVDSQPRDGVPLRSMVGGAARGERGVSLGAPIVHLPRCVGRGVVSARSHRRTTRGR